jgi:hypothetical protein
MISWVDEIDLDPTASWRRMATRALGDRPWLVADAEREAHLRLKAELLRTRRELVLVESPESRPAGEEVATLVTAAGFPVPAAPGPLEAAARSVQEDLSLLRRREGSWHLDAGCVCFPSRWSLPDKVGRPLVAVHAPTPGYDPHLVDRVDRLLDHLGPRPVLRRNWFVHPDPSLHQPLVPDEDPIIPKERALDDLYLRSERQTLRALPSGWILFTIRVQQVPVGDALADPHRRADFVRYLRDAAPDEVAHRGMAAPQVPELLAALGG